MVNSFIYVFGLMMGGESVSGVRVIPKFPAAMEADSCNNSHL